MAEALVGGAFLSAALNVLFERMASRQVLDFFKGQKLNAQLLKKLKIKMITVNKVLDDAEDKQHTNPYVKQWLDELKDVVYEVEDFLDEIASQVQRSKIEAESQTPFEKVQDFASTSSHFGSGKKEKLEEILETLEYLIDQKDALGLIDGAGEKSSFQRTPTTSIPDESVTYGRDADKKAIMEWLLSDDANNTSPDVLAIVGMGGLGKTTLAQVVYRDSRADDYFDQKAWVYVSEEFNVSKVTKDILQGFSKRSSHVDNLDLLQNHLEDDLTGKKFLLILDDVWNKQYSEWDHLLKPLRFGKKGSKILVTTRDEEVAQIMQTSPAYQLEKLSEKDCWLLFQKHAFNGRDSSPALTDLEWIGRQIIKKCDGLPLATKVLGGALRSKRDPREWMKILKSDVWNVRNDSILSILRLSYRFLPSHLKRCFAYCAIFPKGYEFEKEQLIHLWMAEGLLSLPKVNIEIEEVEEAGKACFDDLVSRSFLKQSTKNERFIMHDLINDLAKSIAGEFYFRLGVDKLCEAVERVRHLWFDNIMEHKGVNNQLFTTQRLRTFLYMGRGWPKYVCDQMCTAQHPRSLVCVERGWSKYVDDVEVQNSLSTFTHLRVLCFQGQRMTKLPDSISDLILLRYLDLSRSSIVGLPDSAGRLCNLETLILYQCKYLVELPATTFKLINLCQLDIRGTKLRNMPPRMGKLRKLGELAYFIVGKECDYSIKELGELKRLRGCLRIEKLENILQVEESTAANLKCKEKLEILELIWSDEGSEGSVHVRNVLEQLRPHANIEQLSIYGYAGTRFPDWVGESSFSNMVELKLERCRYCWSLPPLGQLGSLKRLSIIEFDVVTVLGPEFYGNSNMKPFECLEYLRFERMQEWQEWVPYSNVDERGDDGAAAAFPLLQVLTIKKCPKLKKALPACLPSLKELEIKGCDQLASLPRAPAIQQLLIDDLSRFMSIKKWSNSGLQRLEVSRWKWPDSWPQMVEQLILMAPNFLTTIHDIKISGYDSLTSFPLDMFPLLERLDISRCPNLETLSAATTEADAENLKSLTIKDCPNLKRIQPTQLTSLTKLVIRGSDQLSSLPGAPKFQTFLIEDNSRSVRFGNMHSSSELSIFHINHWHLATDSPLELVKRVTAPSSLTTIHDIRISGYDSLTSFSLDMFPLLENIKISDCPNLETLSAATTEADAENLKSLTIEDCPNLKRIQPTQLISLTTLVIRGSDQLSSLPGAPTIQKFEIKDNSRDVIFGKMDSSSELPSLHINRWSLASDSPLEVVKQLMTPNSITLENLDVSCWDSFTSFPMDLFPISEALMISDCPRLESLSAAASEAQPLQHCKSLRLSRCPYLKRLPESKASLFPSLVDLSISYCPEVGPVVADLHRQIPNLSDLALDGSGGEDGSWCQQLGSFPPEGMLLPFFLTFLKIWYFPNLKSFHNLGLQSLSSLKGLEIGQCPNLESLGKTTLQSLPSLRDLRIFWCPTLQTLPELPPTLTSLTLVRLQNMEFLANISLKSLTSLRALWIAYCPKLQSLQMPSTLTSLKCVGFEDVESLDHLELNRLTSLTKFYIFDCPKLQSIAKEGLPSSLQKVDIIKCPLLKVDQDWPFEPPR